MAIDRKPEFFKGAQLKVGIIGCGYVGLPLALRFAEAGHKVTGFDTDPHKISMLNAGKSYIEHIQQTKIQQFVNSKHFGATTDFSKLKEVDAIIICVPTPLDERREPDLSYVEETAKSIYPHLQKGQLVSLESTTYPGTTEELVLPILEKSGLTCKIAVGPEAENIPCDFFLAFSPEREDPGNKQYGLAQIPKVVGGLNPPSYGFMGGIQRYPGGGGYGKSLKEDYRRYYGAQVYFSGRGEMIPNDKSYCEIDPVVKDKYGIPVLRFHWQWTDYEYNQVRHMQQTFRALVEEMGGQVFSPMPPQDKGYGIARGGEIIHELGTVRMGNDPSKSALDANCRAHDVKNLFVTDGGPFVSQADKNPTWTILALAMRTSEYIAAERKRGAL